MITLHTCPDSTVVCRPEGTLDYNAATQLRHLVGGILSPDLNLVLDLSRVHHIDGVGASALVGSVRRVRAMGGRSRISDVNPRIKWVLEVLGIDRFLTQVLTPEAPDAA
jgi:anti-anti-sigma factor